MIKLRKEVFTISRCKVLNLGNNVKKERISKGISQSKMASDLGISRQTIHSIENHKSYASLVVALRIADYLEIEVSRLFFIEEI